jgi:hypothetical protein
MFESYIPDSRIRRRGGKTTLTVRRNGTIGLGKLLLEKYGVQHATHARLFYEGDTEQICVEFLEEEHLDCVPIVVQEGNCHKEIRHTGFAKSLAIEHGDYHVVKKEDDGVIIFSRNGGNTICRERRVVLAEVPARVSDEDLSAALELVGGKRV